MVIFDCNGVLVDSEPIAAAVFSEALGRIGVRLSAAGAMRRFHGRRPADVFAAVEAATGRPLPPGYPVGAFGLGFGLGLGFILGAGCGFDRSCCCAPIGSKPI
jgi:hypothetical protein